MADEQHSGGDEPIIIKKGKKGGEAPHGGAWKVAYADFVTAMMALFIVLWVLAQSEEVRENVAGYFKDPLGFKDGGSRSLINIGPGGGSGKGKDGNNQTSPSSKISTQEALKAGEAKRLSAVGEELKAELTNNDELKKISGQVEFQIIEEGLRIEIMDSQSDAFFEIGTAKLKQSATNMMELIGKEISRINNKIVIEGHTDARPFPGGVNSYSNYELSSDRANAARRALIMGGLPPDRIDEIRGYADNRLRIPSDPYNVLNRRISIIVKYSENYE